MNASPKPPPFQRMGAVFSELSIFAAQLFGPFLLFTDRAFAQNPEVGVLFHPAHAVFRIKAEAEGEVFVIDICIVAARREKGAV